MLYAYLYQCKDSFEDASGEDSKTETIVQMPLPEVNESSEVSSEPSDQEPKGPLTPTLSESEKSVVNRELFVDPAEGKVNNMCNILGLKCNPRI